jgi:preprotein translocase SecE subunit
MLLAAIIMLIVSALFMVIDILVNISDLISRISEHGFGEYLNLFFEYFTTEKFFFLAFALVAIIALVLLVRVALKSKKTGEKDESVSKGVAYVRGLVSECKKIAWPTGKTVVRNLLATAAVCAVVAVIVCVIDFGLGALVRLLTSL